MNKELIRHSRAGGNPEEPAEWIPAYAGMTGWWIPACAGMTGWWIPACAGMTGWWIPACAGMTTGEGILN